MSAIRRLSKQEPLFCLLALLLLRKTSNGLFAYWGKNPARSVSSEVLSLFQRATDKADIER